MKTNITQFILATVLGFAITGTSYAHEDSSEGQSLHWLSHVSESKSQPTTNQLAPYGYAASGTAAREVIIDSGTKYLNVTRLETIRINVGGKSVTWMFDTLGTASFPLANIIPGAGDVTVYVTENPAYRG
uniref:CzcE family metal-binding protein n=1 Tax=Dechloromonas aromatica (strain RCB) TaxID=159087 RepID=Q47DR1_DECAR